LQTTTICGARKFDGSSIVRSTYGLVEIGSTTIDHGGKIKDRVKTEPILAYAYVRHGVFKSTRTMFMRRKKERTKARLRALAKGKRAGTK
jgi:hypothetical protein